MIAASSSPVAAQGSTLRIDDFISPQAFGAIADGSFDCTDAIQRAVEVSLERGLPVYFPPGVYLVRQTIRVLVAQFFPHAGAFGAGVRILGAGLGATIFESAIADGPLFEVDTDADHRSVFRGALGCRFEGFTIRPSGRVPASTGIKLRSAFQVQIRDIHISGLAGDGVEIECLVGDNDGSNMIRLEQVRIENCSGWGVAAAAASGHNEISFLHLQQVFIQNCGTASNNARPTSGGMKWKGQVCTLEQCAFTLNRNVGLFVPGEAGLAQTLHLGSTAFENNYARHVLVTGITGLKGRNLQFYSNDQHTVAVAFELDGGRNTIRSVDLDGVVVRATSGNRLTAFRISGPHAVRDSCRIRNVVWENYDYPGQRRFDGFSFDHVDQCCAVRVVSPVEIHFGPNLERPIGNSTPLRLRGGHGGAPSTTGEWIAATIVSPLVLQSDGLPPDRRWFIYLYDDNGVRRLSAEAEAPVVEPLSGYPVHPRDRSKLHVGSVNTDASGRFVADQVGR